MIDEYVTYLRSIRGFSENTIKAYTTDIREFCRFMKSIDEKARWSNISLDDIDMYVKYHARNGQKPSTTNRKIASISSIFNYMIRQGYLELNPCKYESRRKVGDKLPNTIPASDLKAAYENSKGNLKAMIGLLTYTGIRLQEMMNLTYKDINDRDNQLIIHGKGSKDRVVYCHPDIINLLLQNRKTICDQGKIFYGTQWDIRHQIWLTLKQYSNAQQLSPHAIRHTVATNLAKHGTECTIIQRLLGHKDIRTTQKYIDMTQLPVMEAQAAHAII